MKKCAQCGKDIPTGNNCCNYCGYNPEELNKKQGYSFGKVTNHGSGKTTSVNGNSKVGKIILIVFLITFFGPFVLGVILMIVFASLFASGVFEEEEVVECPSYCVGEYVYGDNYCYCASSEEDLDNMKDYFDDIDFSTLENNIHFFETNTINLDRVVDNQEDAVVVLCSTFSDSTCSSYVLRMLDVAQREGFNLFIYKYESLDPDNQEKLLSYYLGVYSEFSPLTFIMSNGKMKSAHQRDMVSGEIEDYLISNGII